MSRVDLTSPIKRGDETVSFLDLREPTGKDIRICGYPFNTNGAINTQAITNLISTLAAVPPSTVDALSLHDWNNAMQAVANFIEAPAAKTS